jgi:hypothetical protein
MPTELKKPTMWSVVLMACSDVDTGESRPHTQRSELVVMVEAF